MDRSNGRLVTVTKEEVFRQMRRAPERGKNYRWWLRGLATLKYVQYIMGTPLRGELLESYYVAMRWIDDVVDGDRPLPTAAASKREYVEQRMQFVLHPENPVDRADVLLQYCFSLAHQLGPDILGETVDIMQSMLFDAERIGKIVSSEELNQHFYWRDISGTIRGALKVSGEGPEKFQALVPLGTASRKYYILRDYEEEVERGIINIPREACERLGILPRDLESRLSPPVQQWFREEAEEGLRLLAEHKGSMERTRFRVMNRLAFSLAYARPAERYFQGILYGRG